MAVVGPVERRIANVRYVDFVVEANRAQLTEIVTGVRDGRLRPNIGEISRLDTAVASFNTIERRSGKTVVRVR